MGGDSGIIRLMGSARDPLCPRDNHGRLNFLSVTKGEGNAEDGVVQGMSGEAAAKDLNSAEG